MSFRELKNLSLDGEPQELVSSRLRSGGSATVMSDSEVNDTEAGQAEELRQKLTMAQEKVRHDLMTEVEQVRRMAELAKEESEEQRHKAQALER